MKRTFVLSIIAAGAILGLAPLGVDPLGTGLPPAELSAAPRPAPDLARIPLQFVPNRGQAGAGADFYVQGRDKSITFSETGLDILLKGAAGRWRVSLDFVSPGRAAGPFGLEETGATVSYFKGRPEDWRSGIPTYAKIAYRDLWPGIDLVFSGTVERMKYEFIVRPGADPDRIRLAYRGASRVRLTEAGRLDVLTPAGGFQDDLPVAFQEIEGQRLGVPVAYVMDKGSGSVPGSEAARESAVYGFRVGTYDRSRPLVLDPAVLVRCGFIGGTGADEARGVALDSDGNIYIAGETSSMDLISPVAAGPDWTYNGGGADAFVAKLNPAGTALVYCGYIGGAGADRATALTVDSQGNVYIAGITDSTETSFPVTAGPDLTYNGGASDAFVAKMSGDGTALAFCGYIGGSDRDTAVDVAWAMSGVYGEGDPAPSAFVTGVTSSSEATFPVIAGPDLTYNGGGSDAYVARVKPDGSGLESCGYLGGSGTDETSSLAVVQEGFVFPIPGERIIADVYVAGRTSSPEATFPVVSGPDLTYNGGEFDAFVARVKADWTGLEFCGYIGGAGLDAAADILVNTFGSAGEWPSFSETRVLVTGYTSSSETTFPATDGPDLTYNGGEFDAFVAQFSGLIYDGSWPGLHCGYIGGAGSDIGTGLARRDSYSFYVTGTTSSPEATFPVAYASDMTFNGGAADAFVAKIDGDPSGRIASCGYIGGAGEDRASGIVLTETGDLLIVGTTDSMAMASPSAGVPDLSFNGGLSDAFVARIRFEAPTLTSLSQTSATALDPGFTLTATGTGFLDGARIRWNGRELPTTFAGETELRAAVDDEGLAVPGDIGVSVVNPDGGSSEGLVFRVLAGPLTLTSLSPAQARAGGSGFVLTLRGTGFLPGPYPGPYYPYLYGPPVLWNGTAKESIYVSYTELQVYIIESDVANGGEFQVIVKDPGTGTGDSNAIIFPVSAFSMSATPASQRVAAGQSAAYEMRLAPQFAPFDSSISLAAAGLPDRCKASFSQTSVTPGAAPAAVTLTLSTKAPSSSGGASTLGLAGRWTPLSGLVLGVVFAAVSCLRRRRLCEIPRPRWLAGAAAILLAILLSSCAADIVKDPGTPPGTYSVTVTAASGKLRVSAVVELTVK